MRTVILSIVSLVGGATASACIALAQTWKYGGAPANPSYLGVMAFVVLGAITAGFSAPVLRMWLKSHDEGMPSRGRQSNNKLEVVAFALAVLLATALAMAFPLLLFTVPSPLFEKMIDL